MAVQTAYAARIAPSFEGMIANSEDQTVKSCQVESAAGIGFGKVAVQGTADDQIKVSAAVLKFRGITIAAHDNQGGATADLYPQYATVPVLIQGVIWVLASVAVAVGDPVYYVPATGVLTNVSTANTQIPGAIWESSTSGAGLAKIRIP